MPSSPSAPRTCLSKTVPWAVRRRRQWTMSACPPYRSEEGVPGRISRTETFVAMRLLIDKLALGREFPFYLRTGKRLPGRHITHVRNFSSARDAPSMLFPRKPRWKT